MNHWKDGDETPRRKRMSDTAPQTAEVGVIGMAVMGSNLARNMARKLPCRHL
ncbi:6-phosphogluconate dehydrogenase [Cutibacterium acnes JCM 18918]|nr:6-phosphogluconate dehydrogenase [Cutibacterium acnes JCM 18918]